MSSAAEGSRLGKLLALLESTYKTVHVLVQRPPRAGLDVSLCLLCSRGQPRHPQGRSGAGCQHRTDTPCTVAIVVETCKRT